MFGEDLEEVKDNLIHILDEVARGISICPHCQIYLCKFESLRKKTGRIKSSSGIKKILSQLVDLSGLIGACPHCEKFAIKVYEGERKIEQMLCPRKSPSGSPPQPPSLTIEEIEHLISTKYPFPISYAYKLLKRNKNLSSLINCFDVTMRYMCYILVADAFNRYQIKKEIEKPLEKLRKLDLGPKGVYYIISSISKVISPDHQFIPHLTDKFSEIYPEYKSLYDLRCKDKHYTSLQPSFLDERMDSKEYESYLKILRNLLKKLRVFAEYPLAIIKNPIDYDKNHKIMLYEIVECMGDDRDFSEPHKLGIFLKDLVPNNYVVLIKNINSSSPDNLLLLYPLIIASSEEKSKRDILHVYHHFERKDKGFYFFDPDIGEKKIRSNTEADERESEIYNELYKMILL